MENKETKERSPVMIVAGLVLIIVISLVVLGTIAIQQRPIDGASAGNGANTEAVANAASTPANETSTVTDTAPVTDTATAVVSDTTTTTVTDTTAAAVTDTVTTAVTDTTTAIVTDTASAVITNTTTVSTSTVSNTAAVTATAPLTAAPAAPVAAAPVDIAAVTAAVTKGTCNVCHTIAGIDIAVGMIGPDLSTIGADAATRIEGYTAEAYLRESILDPNAFIAPKCPTGDCLPGLMLPNLADILTPAEIDTIVNYLLTLKGQ